MIKNIFFSPERFLLLCKKDLMESWKTMLLRFVTLYAILAILFLYIGYLQYKFPPNSEYLKNYYVTATFICWGFGCLFASLTMENMGTKIKRISYLMTPATSFEKYISRLILTVVLFIVASILAFKLADYTRVIIYSIRYPEIEIHLANIKGIIGNDSMQSIIQNWGQFFCGLSIYLFFQSLFVLGSTLWYKKPFIKTLAAGLIIVLAFIVIDGAFIHFAFKDGIRDFGNSLGYYSENASQLFSTLNVTVFFSFFTLLNWTLAYFRFKESEIINRI